MFARILLSGAAALWTSACAIPETAASNVSDTKAEAIAGGSKWQPYPGTSKDAEFLKKTPTAFRPFVEACDPWDEWDKPAPPFKVFGNTYYVGTCGIAAILITSDEGHILIDSGTEAGAKVVLANIRSLGIDPKDIESLLQSHEHFDHVGGMATVEQVTGGQIHASPEAGLAMMIGGKPLPDDPQFGMHDPMKTISKVTFLKGNEQRWDEQVEAYDLDGGIKLKAHRTPGHTPGALSWQWKSCEGDRCLNMVYADSLSPVSSDSYKFSDHPDYVRAYFDGIARLGRLDCDILLTPHPSHSRMLRRMRTDTMIEPSACAYYAIGKASDLETRLKREADEKQ